ncbi:MAG: alkaline phosphatase [Acidobacteria bacterium]|nr:alkaline phosphatase [Acidobacteriota bacterium]
MLVVAALMPACGDGKEIGRGEAGQKSGSAVLFIGDGMGPGYVTAARLTLRGTRGRLRLDEIPYTAVMRNYATDSPVTDSAAAASAMACGHKTANGVICQDASAISGERDGRRLESIALWAKRRGMRVGIVTTTRVTHATPAAFFGTHNDREEERDLARQAIDSPLDFIIGGGLRVFTPERIDSETWAVDDDEDLMATAREQGWVVVEDAASLMQITTLEKPVLGLFADSHLPYEWDSGPDAGHDGGSDEPRSAPTLLQMTTWAIDRLLGSAEPFLLVVEAGRIDHAGHDNRARTAMHEVKALDDSVGVALDRLDPESTLVLVTADHETGGLVINGYPDEKDGIWGTYYSKWQDRTYTVLTFATGPGMGESSLESFDASEDRRPSGVRLKSAAHTGMDVLLYGWGRGAEQVHGTVDNTAIYPLLRSHIEGTRPVRGDLINPPD